MARHGRASTRARVSTRDHCKSNGSVFHLRRMERTELVAAINDDLAARAMWDTRQAMFYEMRFSGLRRKNKPFPNASDVHFPLADSVIERLKPHYFQQLFATEQLAAFLPSKAGVTSLQSSAAAQWFDYQLKQNSNLETECLVLIDKLLMCGRPVMKVVWDVDAKKLRFSAIPPQYIIVPVGTRSLEEADRVVHVQHYSPEGYARQSGFKQGDEFIKKITGAGTKNEAADTELAEPKYRREGLTHGDEKTIVVWEIWTQDADGWRYVTLSPLVPNEPIKPEMRSPYAHKGPPFVDFTYEVNDASWYSPRGVVEIVAVFEAELCKLLNEKNDAMTFFNRPLFRASQAVPNANNLRLVPGQILPQGVEPVQMPSPPLAFDQQIVLMRDIAERLVAVPDFGMSQVQNTKDTRTATEIAAIGQMSQQSADLRMRIFRIALGRLYRMAWSLLLQNNRNALEIFVNEDVRAIDQAALVDAYSVVPSGSSDGVNKTMAMNKAVARFQMFKGDPFIQQAELRKSMLEADDAGLVKRLFTDPGLTAATQAEDQAQEISVLRLGFPAVVTAADDHAVHLQTLMAYIAHQAQLKTPPHGTEMQALQQHAMQHIEALRQADPKQARQAEEAWAMLPQLLAQQAQQQQQTPTPPTNETPQALA